MFTVEIEGASADRFRAYTVGDATRKPTREDIAKAAVKGIVMPRGSRIKYQAEHVAFEGAVSLSTVTDGETARKVFGLNAGDVVVSRVVFYSVQPDTENEEGVVEQVVGSVEVNAAGQIDIEVAEPSDEDVVIDAAALE